MSHYLDLGEKGKPVERRMEPGRFGGETFVLRTFLTPGGPAVHLLFSACVLLT